MDRETALKDFKDRMKKYESIYETLDVEYDKDIPYIKLYNVGQYLTANRCNGVLESDVIFYLLNAHIQPRKIWLCLHGQTDNDSNRVVGGDPPINEDGIQFSKELHDFMNDLNEKEHITPITILCDTSHRVYQTVRPLQYEYQVLDEL